jgi:hypothetical protein
MKTDAGRFNRLLQRLVLLALVAGFGLCATAERAAAAGRRVALLVGVNQYPETSGLSALDYCERDVEDLARLLEKDLEFHTVHVMTLSRFTGDVNNRRHDPSVLRIQEELDLLLKNLTVEDQVIVAFSGHGVQVDGTSYFCPVDANILNMRLNTLLPMEWVFEKLDQCPAGLKLLICDACRNDIANDNAKGRGLTVKGSEPVKVQAQNKEVNFVRIFSCQSGQRSYEDSKLGHGVFFHFLLKGLSGDEGAVVDGCVTANSLAEYVQANVSTYATNALAVNQKPHIESDLKNLKYRTVREMNWLPPGCQSLYEPWDEEFRVEVVGNLRLYKTIKKPLLDGDGKPLLDGDGNPLEVVLHLVKTRPGEPAPFYMMENKVWTDLFVAFGRQHPEALDEDSAWGDLAAGNAPLPRDEGRRPVFNVGPHEARRFAEWLGGRLPGTAEWDKAAGLFDEGRDALGPYRQPPGDKSPRVAVGLQAAVPVGTMADDVSPYGIRDMAGNGKEFTGTLKAVYDSGVLRPLKEDTVFGLDRSLYLRGRNYRAPDPLTYGMIEEGLVGVEHLAGSDCSFRVVIDIEL